MSTANKKRRWWTIAYFTREGVPHPAHGPSNFVQHYMDEETLLGDLVRIMSADFLRRGAYAAAMWPGQLSPSQALRSPAAKPLHYVYEGGSVQDLPR